MAERAQLVTELRVDDQLTGKLGAAKAQLAGLDAQAKKTGTSLGGLGSSLGGIAKAGIGAFAAFKALDLASDFLGGAVKGAIDEEAGLKRLTQALEANVPAWDGNTAAIERTIDARTALGFKDDELRSSFTSLVAATHNVNAAFAIQSTAADLARFKNISLEEATARLIKVQAGSFRALKDLGISLKAGASGTAALGEVQKVVAGQAEAFGNTTAGAMAKAEAAVDKLSDAIGTGLAPAVAKGADTLTDFLNKDLPSFAENSQREIDDLTGAVQDFLAFAGRVVGVNKDIALSADDVAAAADRAGAGIADWTAREREGTAAAADLGAAVVTLGIATEASADAALEAREKQIESTKAAAVAAALLGDASAELNNDLLTAANGMLTFASGADTAASAMDRLNAKAGAFSPQATMDAFESGLNVPVSGLTPNGSTTTGADISNLRLTQAAELAARQAADAKAAAAAAASAAKAAGDRRLAEAKRRAQEEARAYEKALGGAFDKAKARANSLFDTLHTRTVQAIKDAETLADRQHAGALEAIADQLKAAQAANAAPVTAAQTALDARQQAQSRRGLVESLSAAQVAVQTNTDPAAAEGLNRSLRDATEALENFDDAAKIARLTTVQGTEDAKAKTVADAATLRADAALTAAKAQAQKALDRETIAAAKRTKDFETALVALEAGALKAKKSPAEVQADIAKLEGRFGITTDPVTGFHHITDPLITAIKNVTIAPPVVNLAPVFNAIFRVGARDVAAALASQSSPTSTPMVRTGAAGRS